MLVLINREFIYEGLSRKFFFASLRYQTGLLLSNHDPRYFCVQPPMVPLSLEDLTRKKSDRTLNPATGGWTKTCTLDRNIILVKGGQNRKFPFFENDRGCNDKANVRVCRMIPHQ